MSDELISLIHKVRVIKTYIHIDKVFFPIKMIKLYIIHKSTQHAHKKDYFSWEEYFFKSITLHIYYIIYTFDSHTDTRNYFRKFYVFKYVKITYVEWKYEYELFENVH